MDNISSRYVAEIETPDGIVTIDCEITEENPTKVHFSLNLTTLDESVLYRSNSQFIKDLHLNNETQVTTTRNDINKLIAEILIDAYGNNSDISIIKIDMD